MPTKATIKQAKYDSTHCKTYGLKLNINTDADIIEKLSTVPSIQGYIKHLVRDDISRTRTDSAPKTAKKEGIIMNRTYGNARTHLTLTGKALAFYNITDPIRIEETETETGEYSYMVFSDSGKMHDKEMSESQLVKWLEDGFDEYMSCQTFSIKPEYIDLWGSDATENTTLTYEDVKNITRGWDKEPYDVIDQLIIN